MLGLHTPSLTFPMKEQREGWGSAPILGGRPVLSCPWKRKGGRGSGGLGFSLLLCQGRACRAPTLAKASR